jgi:hypothetical protein
MIEIDAELVAIAREHLPTFSDCSDLEGRAKNCFDDELAKKYFVNGHQWFIDRYGRSPTVTPEHQDFDVVILDALDPEEEGGISQMLYSDESFVSSLVGSLSEDGVLVIQVGTAATIDDPRPDFGTYRYRESLFNRLEANPDVKAMFVYEEPHAGFLEPHAFLIACRSEGCRSRWYARSDQVDYQIYDRIVRSQSKARSLTLYDGTTQRSYQWPKKGWETVYCRREPTPFECAYRNMDSKAEIHEFDFEKEENSSFRVESTKDKDGKTLTKVFAKTDIRKGSFIMPNHLASSLMVTSRNLDGLHNNLDVGGGRVAIIADLLKFFEVYSHDSAAPGSGEHYVEVGGSVLIRRSSESGSSNVGAWVPQHPSGKRPVYSPVYERHRVSFDVFLLATKDIAEGDEVVMSRDTWNH